MAGPVALTGATGFIGRHIAEQLVGAGYSVRALARRSQADRPGLTWIRGDLEDLPALRRLVAGAVAIIHCAGAVRGASARYFHQINAEGTRLLVDTLLQSAPSARFLLISSLAAREPGLSWYAGSKRAAELILERATPMLQWTALRPPAVYGPGDRELVPLFRAMRRGWLPLAGPRDARFSLLHVSDLASAALGWMSAKDARRALELDDGTPGGYDWDSVIDLAQKSWGRQIHAARVPLAMLHCAAWINLALARPVGRTPMLTPGKLRELSHTDWVCDNAAILEYLDWEPKIRLAEALAKPALMGL
jgi:nucleoside-diphosphate-sugar epimerase